MHNFLSEFFNNQFADLSNDGWFKYCVNLFNDLASQVGDKIIEAYQKIA